MADLIGCRLHHILSYTNRRLRIGMGCCQLDGDYAVCNGDVELCEKPDLLIQHIAKNFEQKSNGAQSRPNNNVTLISIKDTLKGPTDPIL